MTGYTPQEQPDATLTAERRLSLGVPACRREGDRHYPLTPEGAGMLAERGLEVRIEHNAGMPIDYSDERYAAAGAVIAGRAACLDADIVLSPAPLAPADARRLRRGSLLLTMLSPSQQNPVAIEELLHRHITSIALDLIEDRRGLTPFADILAEIDGRAAIAQASAILAGNGYGKGILLGGVTGIVACEVTIIGSGIAACAAARSACGLGATVRMFDNDVYALRCAVRELGSQVIGSAIHPHVLENALRSADVVVATPVEGAFSVGSDMARLMKRRVVVIDLSHEPGTAFPSLPTASLGSYSELRHSLATQAPICLVNPGDTVNRTAAMAMSSTLVTMFDHIIGCNDTGSALRMLPGLRRAAYTFMGRIVNPEIARRMGSTASDINIYLTLS